MALRKSWPSGLRYLAGCLAAFCCAGYGAAPEEGRTLEGTGGDREALSVQLIKTGLYLISGGGSNSVLRFSASGLLLVDGKQAGQYRALMSQVRRVSRISDLPVRLLVVTDHHPNHTGNDAQFLAARVSVIAHENAQSHLLPIPASESKHAPLLTFADDRLLQFGGIEVQLLHFGNAQTDDAAVVYFPDLKVIAVGDLFTRLPPEPDYAAGGSLVDWASFLAEVMKLDFDVVVPGVGPMATKADLQAFKDKIDTLIARANALAAQGLARDRFIAALQTDDLGWPSVWIADQFDRFYADLTRMRGTKDSPRTK